VHCSVQWHVLQNHVVSTCYTHHADSVVSTRTQNSICYACDLYNSKTSRWHPQCSTMQQAFYQQVKLLCGYSASCCATVFNHFHISYINGKDNTTCIVKTTITTTTITVTKIRIRRSSNTTGAGYYYYWNGNADIHDFLKNIVYVHPNCL
jgi:hypothetical protein